MNVDGLEAHPHLKQQTRDDNAASLQCLNNTHDIQNTAAHTCDVLSENAYAKKATQELRKINASLEQRRASVQSLRTAEDLEHAAIKNAITEAMTECRASIDRLKHNARRFMPGN